MRLRTGRTIKRTIYIQRGPEPSDEDTFIGALDAGWAQVVVDAFNRSQYMGPPAPMTEAGGRTQG